MNPSSATSRRALHANDRGAALVEMALLLPILVLLLFGIVEFGRAYNAKITLTHATREAVRVLSLTGDADAAAARLLASSSPLDTDLIGVSSTECVRGEPTSITATYPFSYDIPLFGSATITMDSTAVMRCGG
ncbi:MAG: pilus assembly protein [Actinomycetota bacterium]|nr:pilus assembly protein [Actinomycetota bacterium]